MSNKHNFIIRIVMASTILICLILMMIFFTGCKAIKAVGILNDGKNKITEVFEDLSKLPIFKKSEFTQMSRDELISTLVTERNNHNKTRKSHNDVKDAHSDEKAAHNKTKESNGERLSFWESLIFYIGGPIIIGLGIAGKTYLQIPSKPIIVFGGIFTAMPQLVIIFAELGSWFVLITKIGSGICMVGAIIYAAIKYKQRIARLIHYGQFSTERMTLDEKKIHNKAFNEDAEAKGLGHSDDDKKLVAGVKHILDKAKRITK